MSRGLEPIDTRLADSSVIPGGDLFSHSVSKAVSSALERFTTVFGMGTGGSAALEPPGSKSKVSMHYFSQPGNSFDMPMMCQNCGIRRSLFPEVDGPPD